MTTWPLKAKYRVEPHRKRPSLKGSPDPEGDITRVYAFGHNEPAKPRTGNSHAASNSNHLKLVPRKKSYGPF